MGAQVLVVLLIVLAVVTVVGHLFWLALAAVFRALAGTSGEERELREDQVHCPYCRRINPRGRTRCDWCDRQLSSTILTELADLKVFERQLRRLQDGGFLEPAMADDLRARVSQRQRQLTELPAAGSPFPLRPEVPSPVAPSPVSAEPAPEPILAEVVVGPAEADVAPALPPPQPAIPEPVVPQVAPPSAPAEPIVAAPAEPVATAPAKEPESPVLLEPPMSWAGVLASFMEERNIRWGELIGGLLMVSGAICLVIYLRNQLKEHPLLQFTVAAVFLSSFFGVGLYAYHRWRLENTSRVLLIVNTLLVPLYFFATATLSEGHWTWITWLTELASLGLFFWLMLLAARILVPDGRWFAVAAVLGNSAAVLLVAKLAERSDSAWLFLGIGLAPAAVFAASIGGLLYRWSDEEELNESRTNGLFTVLGVAAFALAVAFGLLVIKGARVVELHECLNRFSLLLEMAAIPLLAAGLTVMQGTARNASLAIHRTVGTLLALLAAAVMLVALGLAWPQPGAIFAVSGVACISLVLVAFYHRFPAVHAGAIACATVAFLVAFHLAAGHMTWVEGADASARLLHLAIGSSSGVALVGLSLLFGLAAELLARFGYRPHGILYAGGSGVVALLSLLIVSADGLTRGGPEAASAAAVYGLYGIAGLAMNLRWRRPQLSYLGLLLLLGTTLWTLRWQTARVEQLWATVLAVEALAMVAAGGLLLRFSRREAGTPWNAAVGASGADQIEAYRLPLLHVAEVVAALALLVAGWTALCVEPSVGPIATAACLVAVYLTLAWGYRSAVHTWIGSAVLLLGLIHTTAFNLIHTAAFRLAGLADQPWVLALLTHATLAVLAGILLSVWIGLRPGRFGEQLRRVFIEPLGNTALISSALAFPLLWLSPHTTTWLAACLFWLAAIWLTAAWTNRSAALLGAAQAVLTLAVVMATTVWLEGHTTVVGGGIDLSDPGTLQTYGIGLGLLTLSWLLVRIGLRGVSLARRLLNPAWPAVDWLVGHALVVFQLALAARYAWLGCAHELRITTAPARGPTGSPLDAFGPSAWWLAALLALALIVALWHRWRKAELVSSLLMAVTVPCLIAGRFGSDPALPAFQTTASLLRWGLAIGFVVCAAAVWGRRTLAVWCRAGGARLRVGRDSPRISRGVLIATAATPVLLLTVLAALLQLSGTSPVSPVADSFFAQIGPSVAYLTPLVLVMAGLIGFALREHSAGYAFSAGLVAEMSVVLGYALSVSIAKRPFAIADLAVELQLATITAAVWAGIWLVARRWVNVWREEPSRGPAQTLMRVQLGMGHVGNGLLLVPALMAIAFPGLSLHAWSIAAGTWLGWLALVLAAAVAAYREVQQGRPVQPFAAGMAGMAALGLLACSVAMFWPDAPEWGYRTLMLGWAMYALFIVLATWWVASLRTLPDDQGPPQSLIRAAAAWVSMAGMLAVLLGLKAAVLHRCDEDLLWAAAAIAVASMAGAAMAVWRRQEGWAFAAAPGVNLAASLVVWFWHWHFRPSLTVGDWWLLLVQANVIASAAVALVWLAARKRLYELRDLTLRGSPLLAVQTTLGVIGNLLLLIPPVVALVQSPGLPPDWMAELAAPPGWIALLMAAAAAAWYLRQVSPQDLFHTVGGLGLGIGVLAACAATIPGLNLPAGLRSPWLAYHVAMSSWAVLGLLVLGVGWWGKTLRLGPQADTNDPVAVSSRQIAFPSAMVQAWVTFLATLAVGLALLWCHADPDRPWWSVGAIAGASLAAGLLAMWLRLPHYVFISGLLWNAAGTVMWLAWGPETLARLVQYNVLCLATASAVWSLLRPLHADGVPSLESAGRRLTFAHLAIQAGLALLAVLVAATVLFNLQGLSHLASDWFCFVAVGAAAAAVVVCLWDRSAQFPLAGLYVLGLSAVGFLLDALALSAREFCWTAGYALAGFVLAAAALGWLLPRANALWRALRIPHDAQRWPAGWFSQSQCVAGATAAALGAWISMDADFGTLAYQAIDWLPGRMVGPLAALGLLLAAILMASRCSDRLRREWQSIAIGLSVLLLSDAGWAWLDPATPLPWLHRSAILMASALATMGILGLGLPRLLPKESDWRDSARRMAPVLGGLACLMLVAVFVQEVCGYQRPKTPMAMAAIVLVALSFAGSIAACVVLAVFPQRDPLRLSDRGRQAYVYLAELLLFLLCVHLKLTVPQLFEFGIVEKYWMLLVLLAAFGGVGLSEFFHRRGLSVLAEPLERTAALLPLAPAIGFWIPTGVPKAILLAGPKPAVWFLGAMFYGVRAVTRRSGVSTILSVVALGIGFCVLWHQHNIGFLDRPQLWIIPFALSALIAEHLNHERLNRAQSGALRYLAMSLIYVSTCADVFFISGFAHSLNVQVVLLLLSVLGALAGIVLRIRSFLALGSTFLAVSLLSMISYAVVHLGQWVLWSSIIALGLAIIALFAIFEKRRNDILNAMEQLKHWQQ